MLDVEQRAGVTVVRLRHGKVSALDLELVRALTAVMRDLDGNGAVVITGTGSSFSAEHGLDAADDRFPLDARGAKSPRSDRG